MPETIRFPFRTVSNYIAREGYKGGTKKIATGVADSYKLKENLPIAKQEARKILATTTPLNAVLYGTPLPTNLDQKIFTGFKKLYAWKKGLTAPQMQKLDRQVEFVQEAKQRIAERNVGLTEVRTLLQQGKLNEANTKLAELKALNEQLGKDAKAHL